MADTPRTPIVQPKPTRKRLGAPEEPTNTLNTAMAPVVPSNTRTPTIQPHPKSKKLRPPDVIPNVLTGTLGGPPPPNPPVQIEAAQAPKRKRIKFPEPEVNGTIIYEVVPRQHVLPDKVKRKTRQQVDEPPSTLALTTVPNIPKFVQPDANRPEIKRRLLRAPDVIPNLLAAGLTPPTNPVVQIELDLKPKPHVRRIEDPELGMNYQARTSAAPIPFFQAEPERTKPRRPTPVDPQITNWNLIQIPVLPTEETRKPTPRRRVVIETGQNFTTILSIPPQVPTIVGEAWIKPKPRTPFPRTTGYESGWPTVILAGQPTTPLTVALDDYPSSDVGLSASPVNTVGLADFSSTVVTLRDSLF